MAKMKTYRIDARSDDKYKVEAKAGVHTLYIDQPLSVGGSDAGASPVEYLFASLAGCIVTTARIIAYQKKLNLYGIGIKIEGSLDLAVIYGKSTDGRPGVTGIDVSLALDSDMSEVERKNFFEELRLRCPVSDTIAQSTPITIAAV